jgi:hypothetical protein
MAELGHEGEAIVSVVLVVFGVCLVVVEGRHRVRSSARLEWRRKIDGVADGSVLLGRPVLANTSDPLSTANKLEEPP